MRKYSSDFKADALKLSDEIGVKKAATQLGIPYYTLAEWRNRTRDKITGESGPGQKEQGMGSSDARIYQLEKENAELRQANEILKDALGFFAKDRKK